MKLYRRLLTLALSMALTLGLTPRADAASVRVTLPRFKVTLCSQTIDPANEEYPFLVYRDITYLPLTYFGCRLMGLYAKWSPETGLIISDAGARGAYQSTPRVSRNSGALSAQTATGAITICNKVIENNKEEYPFLFFRDVTYLPMTWANMHDLLGCDYHWDAKNGLVIDRAGDANASALYLPVYRNEEGTDVGSIAAWRGWFWYQDDAGFVSRTPMTGGEREQLFELPINYNYSDLPARASLTVRDDALYLTYHLGGATMGHDETYRFHEDGSYVRLSTFSGPVGEFDDLWLNANCDLSPAPDNLRISRDKGATWERFGDENFIYGWAYHGAIDGSSNAYRTSGEGIYRVGNAAYLLGTDVTGWGDAEAAKIEHDSGVCRVDLTTGETEVIAEKAHSLQLVGRTIWYTDFGGTLRHCALDGSNDAAAAFDELAEMQRNSNTDLAQAVVRRFIADGDSVYVALTAPFHVQGGAGVEPHEEATTCLAVLDADGGGGKVLLFNIGAVRSMTAEDGWLTLLTERNSGEMALYVLRDGALVYQNSGPDYLAAGVSGGKLYFVLR